MGWFKVGGSDYHKHKDGSSGYDINMKGKDKSGKTHRHKMHAVDYSSKSNNPDTKGFIDTVAEVAGDIFGGFFGGKKR